MTCSSLYLLPETSTTQRDNPVYIEQAVQVLVSENLDLCVSLVEKAALEKATLKIDESLADAYTERKKYKDVRRIFLSFLVVCFPS